MKLSQTLKFKIDNKSFFFSVNGNDWELARGGIGEGKILNCNIFFLVRRQKEKKKKKAVFGKRLPVV